MTNASIDGSLLFHLTHKIDALASILREGRIRAVNPYGAVRNHDRLKNTQLVACLSEVALENREEIGGQTWGVRSGIPDALDTSERRSAHLVPLA